MGKKEEKKGDMKLCRGTKTLQLRQDLLKKKKKSHEQRTTYPHNMGSFDLKIRFFWLVKETTAAM